MMTMRSATSEDRRRRNEPMLAALPKDSDRFRTPEISLHKNEDLRLRIGDLVYMTS